MLGLRFILRKPEYIQEGSPVMVVSDDGDTAVTASLGETGDEQQQPQASEAPQKPSSPESMSATPGSAALTSLPQPLAGPGDAHSLHAQKLADAVKAVGTASQGPQQQQQVSAPAAQRPAPTTTLKGPGHAAKARGGGGADDGQSGAAAAVKSTPRRRNRTAKALNAEPDEPDEPTPSPSRGRSKRAAAAAAAAAAPEPIAGLFKPMDPSTLNSDQQQQQSPQQAQRPGQQFNFRLSNDGEGVAMSALLELRRGGINGGSIEALAAGTPTDAAGFAAAAPVSAGARPEEEPYKDGEQLRSSRFLQFASTSATPPPSHDAGAAAAAVSSPTANAVAEAGDGSETDDDADVVPPPHNGDDSSAAPPASTSNNIAALLFKPPSEAREAAANLSVSIAPLTAPISQGSAPAPTLGAAGAAPVPSHPMEGAAINLTGGQLALEALPAHTPLPSLPNSSGDDGGDPQTETATRYTGVRQNKGGRFSARIKIGGSNRYIGTFTTAEGAARAFDSIAIQYGRPVETLNFPAAHGGPTIGQAYRKRKLHRLYPDPDNHINLLLKKLGDVDRSNPGILRLTMGTLGVPESRFSAENKYSGVRQQANHWEARIRYKDKLYSMGFYSSVEAAALAWDITAASLRRCSKLNFPEVSFADLEQQLDALKHVIVQTRPAGGADDSEAVEPPMLRQRVEAQFAAEKAAADAAAAAAAAAAPQGVLPVPAPQQQQMPTSGTDAAGEAPEVPPPLHVLPAGGAELPMASGSAPVMPAGGLPSPAHLFVSPPPAADTSEPPKDEIPDESQGVAAAEDVNEQAEAAPPQDAEVGAVDLQSTVPVPGAPADELME